MSNIQTVFQHTPFSMNASVADAKEMILDSWHHMKEIFRVPMSKKMAVARAAIQSDTQTLFTRTCIRATVADAKEMVIDSCDHMKEIFKDPMTRNMAIGITVIKAGSFGFIAHGFAKGNHTEAAFGFAAESLFGYSYTLPALIAVGYFCQNGCRFPKSENSSVSIRKKSNPLHLIS